MFGKRQLGDEIRELRRCLETAFSPETAIPASSGNGPSAGHCAAVAAILFQRLGGKLVSTVVDGESHWFNRVQTKEGWVDIDLTADQFGGQPTLVLQPGALYPNSRHRSPNELRPETLQRAQLLADKAKIQFDGSGVALK